MQQHSNFLLTPHISAHYLTGFDFSRLALTIAKDMMQIQVILLPPKNCPPSNVPYAQADTESPILPLTP